MLFAAPGHLVKHQSHGGDNKGLLNPEDPCPADPHPEKSISSSLPSRKGCGRKRRPRRWVGWWVRGVRNGGQQQRGAGDGLVGAEGMSACGPQAAVRMQPPHQTPPLTLGPPAEISWGARGRSQP